MNTINLCDPHFHIWDIHVRPNPNLGEAVAQNLPVYHAADYLNEMEQLPPSLKLVSSVHVETVVGQKEGGHVLNTVGETSWVIEQMEPTGHRFGVVSYVHLARDTEETSVVLRQHQDAANGKLRGVRMILNHHPENADLTWPQVEHGRFLQDEAFQEGISLLGESGLSFDLQCNPHQFLGAAEAFSGYPATPVILDHLGSFHDGHDDAYEALWRDGMQALSEVPHIHVKLSMLWFGRTGYHEVPDREAKIRDLVLETIDRFGPDRCMFASNYPVDRIAGIDITTLYSQFDSWTAHLPESTRQALFHDTAARVYRMT